MPEFRQNFVTKEWVVIASERAKRPEQMRRDEVERPAIPAYREDCPFCPGHEARTPAPVLAVEEGGQWRLRVVPNKFAALRPDESTKRECIGPFLRAGGFGEAEVVIESPHHDRSLENLPLTEVERVLRAFRTRYLAISSDPRINLVTIFRNYGPLAGTSLEHPHSQIIATPIVPPHVRDPWRHAQLHYDTFGRCAYCEMVTVELEQGVRIVRETEHFVCFVPFAGKTPFETRIYPKRHHAAYSWIDEREIEDLALILKDALLRLRVGINNPDYNFIIRSAASGDEDARYLHWYMVIIPKITTPAGFEIGSGIYINVVPPEGAAEYLRGVVVPA
jgi:UDPglucose--hexose-1-phosphate uridylyltransferase